MAAPDFESAKKKVYDQHYHIADRLTNNKKRVAQANEKAWSLQMDCYLLENSECTHNYDKQHLEYHTLLLQESVHGERCFDKCKQDHKALTIYDKVTNMEDLTRTRNYLACLRPCMETLIQYANKQIAVFDVSIGQSNSFLKKK